MGAEYDDVKDFRKKAKYALGKVQAVYPDLGLDYEKGRVKVLPCKPSITIKRKSSKK